MCWVERSLAILALLLTPECCWLTLLPGCAPHLGSPTAHQGFRGLSCSGQGPAHSAGRGLASQCRMSCLSMVKFLQFLSTHSSRVPWSVWSAALPSSRSTAPPSLVSSTTWWAWRTSIITVKKSWWVPAYNSCYHTSYWHIGRVQCYRFDHPNVVCVWATHPDCAITKTWECYMRLTWKSQ